MAGPSRAVLIWTSTATREAALLTGIEHRDWSAAPFGLPGAVMYSTLGQVCTSAGYCSRLFEEGLRYKMYYVIL